MAKTYLAQDILDFVNNGWPQPEESWYMEDVPFTDREDVESDDLGYFLTDTALYSSRIPAEDVDGAILWQGKEGRDPTNGRGYSFKKKLDAFLKSRTTTTVLVDIPNDKLEQLKTFVTSIKGKIAR